MDKFRGLTFVLTGTLANHTRSKATEIIEKHGGKVSLTVSANTNYVIAGESAGSKLNKAIFLGIKVITKKQFEAMVIGIG